MSDETMTPRQQKVRRLLTLRCLKELVDAEERRVKAEVEALFTAPKQSETGELPGDPAGNLGFVRTDRVPGGWQVTDRATLLGFVSTHWPSAIVEEVTTTRTVSPELVKSLTEVLASGQDIVLSDGEVVTAIPGITNVPNGHKVVVTSSKAPGEGKDRILEFLGDNAAALGLTTSPAVTS